MKKYQIWILAIITVVAASGAVSLWYGKLLFGALPKLPAAPLASQTRPAAEEDRVCSPAEFTVTRSPMSPVDQIEINDQGTILARFIVTTRNCIFPITYAWLMWYPEDLYGEQYHVSLSNAAFYPYARDLKLVYRYASYDKFLCIGAPLPIFDVPVQGVRYHFIPLKNITVVPPNSAQEFIIRGNLLIDRNDLVAPKDINQNEPEYHMTAGIGANINSGVYGEVSFAPRKFIFDGQPVGSDQILDSCH